MLCQILDTAFDSESGYFAGRRELAEQEQDAAQDLGNGESDSIMSREPERARDEDEPELSGSAARPIIPDRQSNRLSLRTLQQNVAALREEVEATDELRAEVAQLRQEMDELKAKLARL